MAKEASASIWSPISSANPLSLLYSSDPEGHVDTDRVNAEGSKPQYVNVEIQGLPTPVYWTLELT